MKKGLYKVFLIILATLFAFAVGSCSVGQEPVPQSYTVQYVAGSGGTIQGKTTQIVEEGKNAETVTAVPDEGYSFVKWSDGVTSAERQDLEVSKDIKVTASFSNKYKTFKLDCGYGYLKNNQTEITFSKVNFNQIDFPVPVREGFAFNGWYIGGTKVTDENGRMLIGESILNKSSTVTAKWTLVETLTYKILLVYVTEINATLPTRDNSTPIDVDYTMSDIERDFCKATTKQLKRYMDGMMDGLVEFEIDEYYTENPVLTENFRQVMTANGGALNELFPTDIPEVSEMLDDYGSVLSVFNMNDFNYPYKLHDASGVATARYAQVNFDSFIYSNSVYKVSLTDMIEDLNHSRWTNWLEVFIHETAHTIELRVNLYSYHKAVVGHSTQFNTIKINKDYYLNAAIEDGERVGIPYSFWKGDIATVTYNVNIIGYGYVGGSGYHISDTTGKGSYITYEILYGTNGFTVTAELWQPNEYEFVGWSDGVSTATRTDLNICSDFTVTAIFRKIEYEVNFIATEGGSIEGETTQHINLDRYTSYVKAVAAEGYVFVGWSDGNTDAVRRSNSKTQELDKFDENHSYTLTAIFEKIN